VWEKVLLGNFRDGIAKERGTGVKTERSEGQPLFSGNNLHKQVKQTLAIRR
jgi:hypothetical protein